MTKFSDSQQSQLAQIGAFLREKREQQGRSIQDIAITTYIRPQLLNGIEAGDPDLLPEPIFVQGFIRRYAETLGLKGVELSQQFTVDSIPSTPRPAKSLDPGDTSTTRLTRLTSKPTAQQPVTATPALDSASLGSDLLEPDPSATDAAEDIPVAPIAPEPFDDSNIFDFSPEADRRGLDEHGIAGNGSNGSGSTANDADKLPVLEMATAEFELPASEPLDDEPSPFVSDLPLAKKTPTNGQLTTSPISYTSSSPLNSQTSDVDTPNLKPFAIGAVVIAALTAGVLVLANVLGNNPDPTVASSIDPVESVEPGETESALPTLPEPEPAQPVSDAPLFLEVEVTAPAWTTAIADDGERLFEGTLNPGDSVVWEAQQSINVFSGNPGGLQISQNGQPAELLGEDGIPSGKDYSVQ